LRTLTADYSGTNLVCYAQSKRDKWLARRTDDGVTRKLALDVFGITLALRQASEAKRQGLLAGRSLTTGRVAAYD
jgi:hypothetical protein